MYSVRALLRCAPCVQRTSLLRTCLISPSSTPVQTAKQHDQQQRRNRFFSTNNGGIMKRIVRDFGRPDQSIDTASFIEHFRSTGLVMDEDPRLQSIANSIKGDKPDMESLKSEVAQQSDLVWRALQDELTVKQFPVFTGKVEELFEESRKLTGGEVASYIPDLARVDPSLWGVSICTVTGQRFSVGDSDTLFTVQSGGKCFNYALLLEECGVERVHKYIGREPSGGRFNQMRLNTEGKPHNPMINSGAMVLCSLYRSGFPLHQRMDSLIEKYCELSGQPSRSINFNMITCDSEMETAHKNYALIHYIKSKDSLPTNTSLEETIKLYTRLCSVEIDCHRGAVMAATLANGGVCPITDKKVVGTNSVKHTLTLMHSCGMYDFSGEFAFNVGLPAKSGVSGVIFVVIPGIMGVCMYSPPVNHNGNSVRGLHFSEKLVKSFQCHMYDNLRNQPHPLINRYNYPANPANENG